MDVIGAVANPGLYRLPRGDRVYEAVAAAGGLSPDADASRLPNLAGRLKDGEQVKVPFAKTTSGTVITRTNLNTATLDELETVPGFIEAFAQECIDYRTNFGGFQNTRELVDILGLTESDYVIARRCSPRISNASPSRPRRNWSSRADQEGLRPAFRRPSCGPTRRERSRSPCDP